MTDSTRHVVTRIPGKQGVRVRFHQPGAVYYIVRQSPGQADAAVYSVKWCIVTFADRRRFNITATPSQLKINNLKAKENIVYLDIVHLDPTSATRLTQD